MFQTIGVIGAMPEEVALIVAALRQPAFEDYAGVRYHFGQRGGYRLVVCCGGVGKTNAACATQVLITKYGANALFFCGIAGNMSADLGIGDVVIGREALHHDADAYSLAHCEAYSTLYTADARLVQAAVVACRAAGLRCKTGRVATGEQFIGDAETKKAIQQRFQPDCVEMEGAAFAQVATKNGVPFVIIRAMSDNSDLSVEALEAQAFDLNAYVKTSSAILLAAVDALP